MHVWTLKKYGIIWETYKEKNDVFVMAREVH